MVRLPGREAERRVSFVRAGSPGHGLARSRSVRIDDYKINCWGTTARVLDGFEDFNRRVRLPLGFRIHQPARELTFLTESGRAEFSIASVPDVIPEEGRLTLSTMRSHDQWNTTVYSDDDRYRGVKNLRTLVFVNREDLIERGLGEFDLVDITGIAKDGSRRTVYGCRAVGYDIP